MERLPKYSLLPVHAALLALLGLALWFAEERALLIDSAYQLFHDINHESILINDNRFTMVLSQLLPWLLIKLHVPLRWIIVAYSAGFILIAYACFMLAGYWLKNRKASLLMLFTLLGMRATFFHCISETFQLMFFAPLLYALVCSEKRGWLRWVALVLTEVAAFFIHPIAVFFIAFIVLYRWIRRRKFEMPIAVATLLLLACMAVKLICGQSGHDQSFVPTGETLTYALTHFFKLNSIGFFYAHFIDFYLFPILLWLLTLAGYARSRQWLKMAFVGLFVAGFFTMSVVVYWQGDGPIGMERTYLPLFFFIGLAFLEDELPRLHGWKRGLFYILFTLLIIVSLVRIGASTRPYANRLAEIGTIAAKAREEGQQKLIVTRTTAEEIFPINIWGLALESMLYTARDGADQTVTIYMEEDDFDRSNNDLYLNPEVYVSVNWWKRWEAKDLNPHYFRLPPQGYKELVKTEKGYEIAPL
jgi:hypothetical protein